jgi:catechol 2,3-dioxygenase-like lactoylglutathione lyase family enzyme
MGDARAKAGTGVNMLETGKLICFVATANPAAAKKFYREVLGLSLVEESPFAIVFDVAGTMLRIQKVQHISLAGYTALGWQVTDICAVVDRLSKKGVHFERYDGMSQDESGIWTSPSEARIAWFKDPDGNTLSLTQF